MLVQDREHTEGNDIFQPKASATVMDFSQRLDAIDFQIGRRIRLRRRHLGLNQSQLGSRIGVTFQQIHKYETGQSAITAARLFAMATAMSCSIEYFFDDVSFRSNIVE